MSETPAPYGTGETRMPSFEDFKERVDDHLGTSLYPMALKCAIDFYDNWQGFREGFKSGELVVIASKDCVRNTRREAQQEIRKSPDPNAPYFLKYSEVRAFIEGGITQSVLNHPEERGIPILCSHYISGDVAIGFSPYLPPKLDTPAFMPCYPSSVLTGAFQYIPRDPESDAVRVAEMERARANSGCGTLVILLICTSILIVSL